MGGCGWVGKYFGCVGVDGGDWEWVGVGALFDNAHFISISLIGHSVLWSVTSIYETKSKDVFDSIFGKMLLK